MNTCYNLLHLREVNDVRQIEMHSVETLVPIIINIVFLILTSCSTVCEYRLYGGIFCLYLQGRSVEGEELVRLYRRCVYL
jgi:hypothetical protein